MKLPIHLDTESSQAYYDQIKTQIQKFILNQYLPAGTALPSIRTLAKDLSCSVITVKRAYQDLEADGLIITKQGRGTFVASHNPAHVEQYKETKLAGMIDQLLTEAQKLGYTKNEILTHVQKQIISQKDE
ncbi:GntR family transcriptional regulator [Hazenella sp. IB182357]|uniref:GntR family transcriptional regulator n=1 Tax=Polycladospora coralii TaxID=2771432 RepID=A0A926N9M0_9BACL|nr:GntR family transcriptional regulator [Polycladospora coralii]MBD1372367.1 GntR family transcriptional regulator [Polycladospora coralii]MBS7531443.1 GntR family transcriptional regulator [Polycladospora coralii]